MKTLFISLKQAIKGIKTRKLQAGLTILGILIGIASIITIQSVGIGAESLITGSIEKVGTRLINVLPGKSDDTGPPAAVFGSIQSSLTDADLKALLRLPAIQAGFGVVQGNVPVISPNAEVSVGYEGVGASFETVNQHYVEQGRFFTEEENTSQSRVVIMGSNATKEIFPKAQKQQIIGQKIKIKNEKFTIIGLLEEKGAQIFGSPDDKIYIPIETAQNRIKKTERYDFLRFWIKEQYNMTKIQEKIKEVLTIEHKIKTNEDVDFSVRMVSTALDLVSGITGAVRAFLAFIAGISLLVGGIGVMNIMRMTVSERTREIGLRKALGATPTIILTQFLAESAILTLLGGILGTILGYSLSYGVAFAAQSQGYEWIFEISPMAITLGLSVAIITGVVFGLAPARKAAKVNPVEALREG